MEAKEGIVEGVIPPPDLEAYGPSLEFIREATSLVVNQAHVKQREDV